jgi:uncharacterized protein YndB with AHSA1/START domain
LAANASRCRSPALARVEFAGRHADGRFPKELVMLKKLAVAAGVLVALAVFAFALLPHSYSVQREVIINASPEAVFTYLTRLEERPKWLAWYQREPTGKASVTQNGGQTNSAAGLPAQPGTTFSWDGQEMGVGSATLTALTPNERLEFALSFKKPFTLDCNDTFVLEPVASGTKVVWTNHGGLEGDGALPRPLGRP